MAITFHVKFCADDIKDYKYKLTFLTEGETFFVPIIGKIKILEYLFINNI